MAVGDGNEGGDHNRYGNNISTNQRHIIREVFIHYAKTAESEITDLFTQPHIMYVDMFTHSITHHMLLYSISV